VRIVKAVGTPTVTSGSAYATGQAIGSTVALPKACDFGFGTILNLALVDKSNQKAAIDILIFNQPLATPPVDKTAVAITAADAVNLVGHIALVGSDYSDLGSNAVATKYNLWMAASGGVDNNLYVQLISRGSPTFTSTSAIQVSLTSQVDADIV
jgi:hypothetical protein